MLFNTPFFLFQFLPLMVVGYYLLNFIRIKELSLLFLIGGSLFFYAYYKLAYVPLILISVVLNFTLGTLLGRWQERKSSSLKLLLILGLLFNLGLLGYYKYSDFFITQVNALLNMNMGLLRLALPLAIGFYTIQQIAYLVDSYKGLTKGYKLQHYALFVLFFPQLIAGPIVSHQEMMPQLLNDTIRQVNWKNIYLGLALLCLGLAKKMLADHLGIWVNGTSADLLLGSIPIVHAWLTMLSYTFQIYFDFSGYADMAIGLGLMFNLHLPVNFNSPYKATSISDFWRRWHITLGHFLRTYLYIPLGGNRKGPVRQALNSFVVFALCGLWHGAGLTFVFWGIIHGIMMITHQVWQRLKRPLPALIALLVTFLLINFSWIPFNAQTLKGDGLNLVVSLFDFSSLSVEVGKKYGLFLMALTAVVFCLPNTGQLINRVSSWGEKSKKHIMVMALVVCVLVYFVANIDAARPADAFIYFDF